MQHEGEVSLNKVASWNHNYFVTSLVAKGNRLIVGDAISSVSVLEVQENNLKTVARDYGPVWPIAVEGTKYGGVIGANVGVIAAESILELIIWTICRPTATSSRSRYQRAGLPNWSGTATTTSASS